VVPKLETIYAQLAEPPSHVLAALESARRWLPVWGPLLPLLIAAVAILLIWRPLPLNLNWLPGRIKYLDAIHKANYADSIAGLLEQNHTLGQALALLGPLPTESHSAGAYAAATAQVFEAERQAAPVAADDPRIQALPALLRWAFTGDLLGQPLPAVLRISARNYRAVARRQSAVVRWWLPALVGSLLGGLFVLAFALSLFWPMVELLRTLTQPLQDIGHAGLRL
jgi:type II secretory pathway component PulF